MLVNLTVYIVSVPELVLGYFLVTTVFYQNILNYSRRGARRGSQNKVRFVFSSIVSINLIEFLIII